VHERFNASALGKRQCGRELGWFVLGCFDQGRGNIFGPILKAMAEGISSFLNSGVEATEFFRRLGTTENYGDKRAARDRGRGALLAKALGPKKL
jgi:hypothetical protein